MLDDAVRFFLLGLDPLTWALVSDDWVSTFSTGDPPELSEVYESASENIAADPSDLQAYFTRGVVCQSKALADLTEVLRRDPLHARAWLLTSEVLAALGEYEKAPAAREQALQQDSSLG